MPKESLLPGRHRRALPGGGNESSKFANALATQGVPVSLVVEFDPVENWSVGGNISRVISYYVPKSADNRILPMDGFKGETKNADVTTYPSRGFVRYVMGFKVLVVLRQELCEEKATLPVVIHRRNISPNSLFLFFHLVVTIAIVLITLIENEQKLL